MKPLNLRNRRLLGIGFIVLALAMDLFFWLIAGLRALVIGTSSTTILIIFGALFISGRWPATRQKDGSLE